MKNTIAPNKFYRVAILDDEAIAYDGNVRFFYGEIVSYDEYVKEKEKPDFVLYETFVTRKGNEFAIWGEVNGDCYITKLNGEIRC